MGMSQHDVTGYGLLVLDAENGYDPPEGIEIEFCGDFCLDEECGLFYIYSDAELTVKPNSEEPISEWVSEYVEYTLENIPSEISDWFEKVQNETEVPCKLGVLKVYSYS